jgi:hypothetical protein
MVDDTHLPQLLSRLEERLTELGAPIVRHLQTWLTGTAARSCPGRQP